MNHLFAKSYETHKNIDVNIFNSNGCHTHGTPCWVNDKHGFPGYYETIWPWSNLYWIIDQQHSVRFLKETRYEHSI